MKKVILSLLLLMFTGVLKAERIYELSNADVQDNEPFAEKVIDGKIRWNVFYEIRKSDYIGSDDYLNRIGQFLKEYPGCTITVKSYADKGTGNPKINVMYSRLRNEKAVAALVAAGVDRKLINASYYGDTVQPFAENDKNRLTIIEASGLKVIKEEAKVPADTVVAKDIAVVEEPVIEEPTPSEPVAEVVPVPITDNGVHVYFTPASKNAISNKHRWFIGANVGAQTYFGDHNRQTKLKDIPTRLITPSADVYVGCWLNRFLAIRVDISGFNIKGLTNNSDSQTGKDNPFATPNQYVCRTDETLDCQRFNYINTNVDLMFNLMQITKKGKEFFDLIPYVGYGWNFAWSPYQHSNHTNAWGFNLGAIFSWRLTQHWGLNIDLRGMLLPDKFDGDGHNNGNHGKNRNNKFEGITSLNLGTSYRF